MTTRRLNTQHSLFLALSLTAGCSSFSATIVTPDKDAGGDDAGVTGGKAGTGGASSTGGSKSIVGSSSTGGLTSVAGGSTVGGNTPAGGTTNAGGSSLTTTGGSSTVAGSSTPGGAIGTGGTSLTGGTNASGGNSTSGGTKPTGGTSATAGAGGTGGLTATGGAPAAGGMYATGGSIFTGGSIATGGITSTGGTGNTGGVPTTGGTISTGGSSQLDCSGGTTNCNGTCVNLQTDKNNCNICGVACESYQFCATGVCLPHYVSTKILPTAALATDASQTIVSAAVETNKAQGDLLVHVLLTDSSVTFSSPTDTYTTSVSAGTPSASSGYYAVGLARYTATGTLVWGRNLANVVSMSPGAMDPVGVTPMVLSSTGDIVLGYWSSAGPFQLSRINANNASVTWSATYSSSDSARTVVPRFANNDYITFGPSPNSFTSPYGAVCNVKDQAVSATESHISTVYSVGAAQGGDGATVWMWGGGAWCYGGVFALNPWSAQTWPITGNPGQGQCDDAYIVGAQDSGATIGPWMSEGDWGPMYRVAVDAVGDLLIAASSGGYTTFNGGQDFLPSAGQVLVKVDHTTGNIVWRTPLTGLPTMITAAPGNRIVAMTQQVDANSGAPIPTAPFQLSIYAGSNGTLLSSFSTGMMAQTVATGTTDMFVIGVASSAADFNPGNATDSQGNPAGVFVSRYSF